MKQSYDGFEDNSDDEFGDEFVSEEDYAAQGAYGDKDDYGYCPICGGTGETVSVGVRQWVVCHRDRVKWRLGLGFFALFQRREKWDQAPRDSLPTAKCSHYVKRLKKPQNLTPQTMRKLAS